MKKNSIEKSALLVLIGSLIARIASLAKESVFAYMLGTSYIADAYVVSVSISELLIGALLGSLLTAYIPIACSAKNEGINEINRFSSNIINISSIFIMIISIVFFIFPKSLIYIFAIGFDEKTINVAVQMLRPILLGSSIICFRNTLASYLQLYDDFFVINVYNVIASLILIISYYFFSTQFSLLGLMYVFSLLIPTLVLYQRARKFGFSYKYVLEFKSKYVEQAFKLAVPVFIASIATTLNSVIDRTFASTLETGVITAMKYATTIVSASTLLIITPIQSVIFPKMSSLASEDEGITKVEDLFVTGTSYILILSIPFVFGVITLSSEIIMLLFMRGAFTIEGLQITTILLQVYILTILFEGFSSCTRPFFFTLKDSKTPVKFGVIALIVNILLNFILIKPLGFLGLAIATVISSLINCLLLIIALRIKTGRIKIKYLVILAIKSFVSSFIMCILIILIKMCLGNISIIIVLLVSFILGVLTYVLIMFLFNVEEIRKLIGWLLNKIVGGVNR
ncbi:MAG: lipid II flippase MurJ [Erysipelotrichales bacterium]|nr:lipid II flippase MurJ [Erysipelotrichales bacterium]